MATVREDLSLDLGRYALESCDRLASRDCVDHLVLADQKQHRHLVAPPLLVGQDGRVDRLPKPEAAQPERGVLRRLPRQTALLGCS